jgi:hypothetical protein
MRESTETSRNNEDDASWLSQSFSLYCKFYINLIKKITHFNWSRIVAHNSSTLEILQVSPYFGRFLSLNFPLLNNLFFSPSVRKKFYFLSILS